ncbi:hypothetical protein K0M31_010278 [Melipona bicolor]|uniref:Uncharacterized protein n=1 Tax=Melipona bicolor TaxID=60889 RepID=A0AA40FLP9_9HYME|nr:hypothetical protein K0M31_010278 [Melipona bicolor]
METTEINSTAVLIFREMFILRERRKHDDERIQGIKEPTRIHRSGQTCATFPKRVLAGVAARNQAMKKRGGGWKGAGVAEKSHLFHREAFIALAALQRRAHGFPPTINNVAFATEELEKSRGVGFPRRS